MDEATQILKNQIDNLPTSLKKVLNDGSWSKKIEDISVKFGLDGWQIIAIKNKTLLVLIGLELYEDLQENIASEADIDPDKAGEIVIEISEKILEKIEIPEKTNITDRTFSPNSYEQILINQAKAMRPVGVTPDNLPTEESRSLNPESSRKEEKGVIHNSIGYTGSDPYREPAE